MRLIRVLCLCPALCAGCSEKPAEERAPAPHASAPAEVVSVSAPSPSASASAATPPPRPAESDPMALHLESREALLALFPVAKKGSEAFLEKTFGVGSPARLNQGNKAIAQHLRSREACLAGLEGVVLQTPEQRETCGGLENMVPIYRGGKSGSAKTCIDVFEFPNKPCELPVVWAAPAQAKAVCAAQGKRLCAQEEWVLACRGDPAGGDPSTYAYGAELDLEACNTSKLHRVIDGVACDPDSAASAWKTCATDTEPAGSFPRCRSRFGVFDQHGNVAEIMTRLDPDGEVYSQLKGSAFFYVEVARDTKGRPPSPTGPSAGKSARDTYPDHCTHDPRWHVEPMAEAWHVNYHLGFRCCKTVR